MLYLFYDLHEWSLDDIAQMARWGNIRAQRYTSQSHISYDQVLARKVFTRRDKPSSHCSTSKVNVLVISQIGWANLASHEWIERKYVRREWMRDDILIPVRRLLPYDVYEQRVFAHLHRLHWTSPAGAFSTASTSGRHPKGARLSVSPSGRIKPVVRNKHEENPPLLNTLLSIEIPVTLNIFASQSFPKVSNETTVKPPVYCLQRFAPLPPPLWKSSTAKPLDWSTKRLTLASAQSQISPTTLPSVPPPESTSSRPETWIKDVPRIPNLFSPPCDRDLSWHETHYNDSDEYSDDLYGSGRPLRPSLINPAEKVKEWQASSHGNPEVTQFLESTFKPDSPRLHEIVAPQPTIQVVQSTVASFFQDEFEAALTSKPASMPLCEKGEENLSELTEILILLQETPIVATEGGITRVCGGKGGVGGTAIVEEDESDLEELDGAFASMQEHLEILTMSGVEDGHVNFRSLSDGGTEVDSELDKIEYEFQNVPALSEEEMEFEEEELDDMAKNENEMRDVVDDVEKKSASEAIGDTQMVEIGFKKRELTDVDTLPEGKDFDQEGSKISVPEPLDTQHTTSSSVSQSSPQLQQSPRNITLEDSSPPSAGVEEREPSPFSDIILGVNPSRSDEDIDGKNTKDRKEDLRNFLLRSGLFATKG